MAWSEARRDLSDSAPWASRGFKAVRHACARLDTSQLPSYSPNMDLKLTAEIHHEGDWFVGFCQEVPEANGQGRAPEECMQNLKEAVLLLMEDRREDARRKLGGDVRVLELA